LRLYRRGLASALAGAAVPYGYTLTVWSAGALLIRAHHRPSLADAFLFIVGAAAGFAVLHLAVANVEERVPGVGLGHVFRRGLIQFGAILGAAGVAAAGATASLPWAWPLASLGATAVYFGIVALEQGLELVSQGF
jgi:hypothetical protein